ncbi:hypothetical protein RhiJN_21076 [Ceratobasidium sp. AG-Ba]|nr:hypothetical protein RhiJN_21076 [Ceratobasidium sp. AG-Ba]
MAEITCAPVGALDTSAHAPYMTIPAAARMLAVNTMKKRPPSYLFAFLLFVLLVSMSKRKILAGGYPDSDDGHSGDELKTTRSSLLDRGAASYAPPRISAVPAGTVGVFQFPQGGPSSRPTRPRPALSIQPTPATQPVLSLGPEGNPPNRLNSGSQSNSEAEPTLQNQARIRSTLSLERQINDLFDGLEAHMASTSERHQRTDDKITYLTTIVEKLISDRLAQPQGATSDPPPTVPAAAPLNPIVFTNPSPTAELGRIVSKVCSEARLRVGKKKPGPEENGVKDHIRTQFYQMIHVRSAKEIRPYFEDQFGKPDTLPSQFADPKTGYIDPCPYWPGTLAAQLEWIPTFLFRVRATIPSDQSDLSATLRKLSDEQILIYLHDGVFKTCQTTWRDARKTPEEIEAGRSIARQYQRRERKGAARGRQIKAIPSLQGPEWAYLSHSGYVSAEESDSEGGLIVKRPDYRPQWEINLYSAIDVAENVQAKPHSNRRTVPRRIELVSRPIPQLQRGTGAGKTFVQVPLCAFNKSWQAKNVDLLQKSAYLVNMKIVNKPDINAFLDMYPITAHVQTEQAGDNVGQGAYSRAADLDVDPAAEIPDGSTQIQGGDNISSSIPGAPTHKLAEHPRNEIPIDPALTGELEPSTVGPEITIALEHGVPANSLSDPLPAASTNTPYNSITDSTASPRPDVSFQSAPPSDMPPPPSPPFNFQLPATQEDPPFLDQPPAKRPRRSKNISAAPSVTEPKRRGRPPGSKNKPRPKP